jgi:uncharacterized membrane protein YhhN
VTATAFLLLAVTLAVAAVDWVAVHLQNKPVEYVAKPLTMVALIAAVLAMQPTSAAARACFVVALTCSLVGDVFLMLPDRDRWFVFGLGAFLLGHLAYVPGLLLIEFDLARFAVGLVLVGVAIATLGRHIVAGVRAKEPALATPVTAYMSVISLMVACAISTGRLAAIVGAVLFYCSDTLIAWTEFLRDHRWGKVAIIVTYHLGQISLALALI